MRDMEQVIKHRCGSKYLLKKVQRSLCPLIGVPNEEADAKRFLHNGDYSSIWAFLSTYRRVNAECRLQYPTSWEKCSRTIEEVDILQRKLAVMVPIVRALYMINNQAPASYHKQLETYE